MILAAGRGERMRPLTDTTPKPLLTAGGCSLIEHHLAALARAGIGEVVINLSWHGEQIREQFGSESEYGQNITYSDEGPTALETGGGIFRALPLLGDAPFWLVNGDVYCDYQYSIRSLAPGDVGHLVLVPNPSHHPAGDFALDRDRVGPRNESALTYSGLAILDPQLFAGCSDGKFPLAPLLTAAIEKRSLSGERFAGVWTDVGTPERLAALDQRLTGHKTKP